ncbi:unnamed protein product [Diatraea saccharalis]|uniref:Protein with SprT-like domain at the N terminus n=1 Tax=Diatraea saccharalis TaxID=40085 RepID=A0A9N9QYC3_9NEOP|nr:unnamed protein product [Diatraea saccharalis]
MNLADPELELIDPTPNVHTLFLHFDKLFFWTKLASRAVVRWSKRMYSCAGVCSYEGRGGLCDIALSEPLLKLRPRKDLIQTLLHEMIHAYLFITCRDRERDGHGPNFKAHMYRINKSAGLNITIYHDFHDEVELYQTHWWRCNGPCQSRKPYFGIVRRPQNRTPGPKDYWWSKHQQTCGGMFIKIKEPEKKPRKGNKTENKHGDITKYVSSNNVKNPLTPVLKNSNINNRTNIKSNSGNTIVTTKNTSNPNKPNPPIKAFSGTGQVINNIRNKSDISDVKETVRNVWANKKLSGLNIKPNNAVKPIKQKAVPVHSDSPPSKIKKIDDYFKRTASSLLSDLYGQNIELTQDNNKIIVVSNKNLINIPENNKIIAVSNKDLVDCPVCNKKVDASDINKHLDECLNTKIIEKLSEHDIQPISSGTGVIASQNTTKKSLKELIGSIPEIPLYKKKENTYNNKMFKEENGELIPTCTSETIDLANVDMNYVSNIKTPTVKVEDNSDHNQFDTNDINKVKAVVKRITYDKHVRKSDNFVVPKEERNGVDCGFLPSFLDDMGTAIKPAAIKIEPGTSKDIVSALTPKCPCCGNVVNKPMAEHLDECLAFMNNDTTEPMEGASTSFANNTIVVDDDDDDIFDETMTMNATGTKTPCPCCMEMIEMSVMNDHLDSCLS